MGRRWLTRWGATCLAALTCACGSSEESPHYRPSDGGSLDQNDGQESALGKMDQSTLDQGFDDQDVAHRDATANSIDQEAGIILPGGPKFPQVPNQGGPIVANMEIVPVFFAGDPLRQQLDQFNSWVLGSTYWATLGSEYGVGPGTMRTPTEIGEAAPTTTTAEATRMWIASSVNSGLFPAPKTNSVYVVFYPATTTIGTGAGRSCFAYYGYHFVTHVTVGAFDSDVPFVVLPRCGDPLDQLTITTSTATQEYFETATDPFAVTNPAWFLPVDVGEPFEPWVAIGSGGGLGDLCTNEPYDRIDGFRVQHMWSNESAASHLNPCQPNDSQKPYFIVHSDQTAYTATPGSTLTIKARAWSNLPTAPWTIGINTAWIPHSDFDGSAELDKTTVTAGDEVTVKVKVPVKAIDAGRQIYQFTIDSLDATNLDFYHPWPVMIVVP